MGRVRWHRRNESAGMVCTTFGAPPMETETIDLYLENNCKCWKACGSGRVEVTFEDGESKKFDICYEGRHAYVGIPRRGGVTKYYL
jgi:hypothetical protein